MRFLVPQGVGDTLWSLCFVESIRDQHAEERIDILIGCSSLHDPIQQRSLDFLRRFSFVDSVEMALMPINDPNKPYTDAEGFANYVPNGWNPETGIYTLIPNAWLDRGHRLEHHAGVRWNIFDRFNYRAEDFRQAQLIIQTLYAPVEPHRRRFCLFYTGPLAANEKEGWNRGPIWQPSDWARLRDACLQRGILPVVVGADYDSSYYETALHSTALMANICGKTTLAQYAYLCRHAEFVVSFPSGLGVLSSYVGTRTAFFIREHGDSIESTCYHSPSAELRHNWVSPAMLEKGNHIGLIYGKCTPESIVAEMEEKGWL